MISTNKVPAWELGKFSKDQYFSHFDSNDYFDLVISRFAFSLYCEWDEITLGDGRWGRLCRGIYVRSK